MDGNRIRILTEGNEDHEVGQDLVIGYRFQRIPVRSFSVVSVFSCKIPCHPVIRVFRVVRGEHGF